ncbi:MAG: hypothetical protein WDO19_03935 [Bacteroidota bacterium]
MTIKQEDLIPRLIAFYNENSDLSLDKYAGRFIDENKLQEKDLEEFSAGVNRMSLAFFPENLPVMTRIRQFQEVNEFILRIMTSLGYEKRDYDTISLEKVVSLPMEAFNYVGHNKLNVEESPVERALIYR